MSGRDKKDQYGHEIRGRKKGLGVERPNGGEDVGWAKRAVIVRKPQGRARTKLGKSAERSSSDVLCLLYCSIRTTNAVSSTA